MRVQSLIKSTAVLGVIALLLAISGPIAQTQGESSSKSLLLDGNASYVLIPYSADLNPTEAITIELWVKPLESRCETLVGNGYGKSYWLGLCSQPRFYFGNARTIGDSAIGLNLNEWNHVVVTFASSTEPQPYGYIVNGEESRSSFALMPAAVDQPLYIGGDRDGGGYYFKGQIDEVRIWNVARTPEEIEANKRLELNEATPGLVAVWHFNGSTNDAVGSHHGLLIGAATYSSDGFPVE